MSTIARKYLLSWIDGAGFEVRRKSIQCVDPKNLPVFNRFVDSDGREFDLYKGYRDVVKPSWRKMFSPPALSVPLDNSNRCLIDVLNVEQFLKHRGETMREKDILEIGCHSGGHAYSMSYLGAASVTATDIVEYGLLQSGNGVVEPSRVENQRKLFSKLRESSRSNISRLSMQSARLENVEFIEVDVHDLAEVDAYDAIVSWETLEHIIDPETALRNIYRSLKPGGFTFHEYNPFFSHEGGHSLCTLDFPWGHVVLDDEDFARYIKSQRPDEEALALNFYKKSLNRVSISELSSLATGVGFVDLEIRPWCERELMRFVTPSLLTLCQKHYPTIDIDDILASFVWLYMKKAS